MERTKEGRGVIVAELPEGVKAIVTPKVIILRRPEPDDEEGVRLVGMMRGIDRDWAGYVEQEFLRAGPVREFTVTALVEEEPVPRKIAGRVLFLGLDLPEGCNYPEGQWNAVLTPEGGLVFWEDLDDGTAYIWPCPASASFDEATDDAKNDECGGVHPLAWVVATRILGLPLF